MPEITITDEKTLREKIYLIRGVQVMLDFELAEIYGYSTKTFNQQVKNNIIKFPEDFRFQLTKEETDQLSRSKILTSMQTTGIKGGRTYLPYAFTEQGIYMLMTVLRGDLAVRQSIVLVRLFKELKDYLLNNQPLITPKNYLALVETVEEHSREIKILSSDVKDIKEKMVTRADLSDFIKLFDHDKATEEILILNGEPFKADLAYQHIYSMAKKDIIVADDYIGTKTLHHLAQAKLPIKITIISDNKGTKLRLSEYNDFITEYPGRSITFIKSANMIHDRYIILDYNTKNMKVFLCGSSSKDSGNKITTILQVNDISEYIPMVATLLSNAPLVLS